jgi:hypothetical protein
MNKKLMTAPLIRTQTSIAIRPNIRIYSKSLDHSHHKTNTPLQSTNGEKVMNIS